MSIFPQSRTKAVKRLISFIIQLRSFPNIYNADSAMLQYLNADMFLRFHDFTQYFWSIIFTEANQIIFIGYLSPQKQDAETGNLKPFQFHFDQAFQTMRSTQL